MDTYELFFRIVWFPLSESSYECVVTNFPADEFPPEQIKNVILQDGARIHHSVN